MAPGFSSDVKELVRERTNLVEIVAETVALTPLRGGSDHVGLCPFHDDHRPSFHVYPDRQSYRCWSCNEGGDCFSFVMKRDGLGFREALELLAGRAGLEVPKSQRRAGDGDGDAKRRLYEAVAWAEAEFHRCLLSASEAARARDYLASRGFTPETIRRFRLGYHPEDWNWLQERARGRYTAEQLFAVRLVREREGRGGYFDDFYGRVLFPIRDLRGRPVAFGGRILPDDPRLNNPPLERAPAKYLNSADGELFSKSRILFGLDAAREAIRRSGAAVVMEGYTDCILAFQHGIENVVATLGTSLTERHVAELKRFTRTVVLVFDGDDAGQRAAEKALVKFLAQEIDLRILTLEVGVDPADFVTARGADAFRALVDTALEAWEQKLRLAIGRYGLESIDARQRVLDEMLELIGSAPRLSGTAREDIILGRLAQKLAMDERLVRQRLKETRAGAARRLPAVSPRGGEPQPSAALIDLRSRDDLLECALLEIIFADPEAAEFLRERVGPGDFRNGSLERLLQVCYDLAEHGDAPSCERVLAALEDPDLKRLAVMIDDSSRRKNVRARLTEDARTSGRGAAPGLRDQVVRNVHWRRERQSCEPLKGRLAAEAAGPDAGEHDRREQLRLLAELQKLHAQRAAGHAST